jgi:hypothetical protein
MCDEELAIRVWITDDDIGIAIAVEVSGPAR